MKDVHVVLRQKEQDLQRVGREIQALFTVIALLADDHPIPEDVTHPLRLASVGTGVERSDNDLAELETYYPFIRHMRLF